MFLSYLCKFSLKKELFCFLLWSINTERSCKMQAKCIEVAVAMLYVVLVSVFIGWGFVHRKKERAPVPRTKPLVNVTNVGVVRRVNSHKDENVPMQVCTNCDPQFIYLLFLVVMFLSTICSFSVFNLRVLCL